MSVVRGRLVPKVRRIVEERLRDELYTCYTTDLNLEVSRNCIEKVDDVLYGFGGVSFRSRGDKSVIKSVTLCLPTSLLGKLNVSQDFIKNAVLYLSGKYIKKGMERCWK